MDLEAVTAGVIMLVVGLSLGLGWGEWLERKKREQHGAIDEKHSASQTRTSFRDEKDRFDANMEVSKHFYQCFSDRRVYEWKLNFALWAGVALVTKVCLSNDLRWWGMIILAAAYLFIFFLYIFWTKSHWWANEQDIRKFHYYRELAENQLIGNEVSNIPDSNEPSVWQGVFANWSRRVQILSTFVVLAFSWSLILVSRDVSQEIG